MLAYLFLSIVATHTQSNSLHSQPNFHMCISVSQLVYIYMSVHVYVPCVHSQVHIRFFGLDLKNGNYHLGKSVIDTLDSLMMKKIAADSKAKGKKHGSTCGLLG